MNTKYHLFGFDESHHQRIKNILTEYFGDEIGYKKLPQKNLTSARLMQEHMLRLH